jgi:hypothetical protein
MLNSWMTCSVSGGCTTLRLMDSPGLRRARTPHHKLVTGSPAIGVRLQSAVLRLRLDSCGLLLRRSVAQ